jgi:hypothetical protein
MLPALSTFPYSRHPPCDTQVAASSDFFKATHHFDTGSLNTARRIFLQLTQDALTPRQILAHSYSALVIFGPSVPMAQINLDNSRAIAQELQNQDVKNALIARLDRLQVKIDAKSQQIESRRAQQAGGAGSAVQETEHEEQTPARDDGRAGLSSSSTPADPDSNTQSAASVVLPADVGSHWLGAALAECEAICRRHQ